MPSIITKATSAGDKKALVLDPVGFYRRKTNLPADWKTVRIGVIMSLTNATEDNGTPVAESMNAADSRLNRLLVGLGDGDTTHPYIDSGNAGRYVGAFSSGAYYAQVKYSSGWYLANTAIEHTNFMTFVGFQDGERLVGTLAESAGNLGTTDPTADTAYACAYALDISVSTANVLSVRQQAFSNYAGSTRLHLNNLMANAEWTNWKSTEASGWWDASTPVGCQYLYFRHPFRNNRVRLLGIDVRQMA